MEKRVTQRFRSTSVRLGSYSDLLSKHMRKYVVSFIQRSLVHLEQAAIRATTRGDTVDALEEEEEFLTPLLAALPLFQPTLRPSKTSLRRSSNMSSSASLMMPRLPAAELCTTSMCSPSRSRSWAAISAIVCRASPALALAPIGTLNLPGGEITFQQKGVGGWVVQLVATYLWR